MSKYKLGGSGFVVGAWVLPSGTVINTDVRPPADMDFWSLEIWKRNVPPPIDAQPLTRATYREMIDLYPANRVAPVPEEQR
jgi:hypothetical protein